MPSNAGYQQLVNEVITTTRVMNSKGKWLVIGAIGITLSKKTKKQHLLRKSHLKVPNVLVWSPRNWLQKAKWFCIFFGKLAVQFSEKEPLRLEMERFNLNPPKYYWKIGALSNWQTNGFVESWSAWNSQSVEGQLQNVKKNPTLCEELTFSWKKNNANLLLQHKIPDELILNLDQTTLTLVSHAKWLWHQPIHIC